MGGQRYVGGLARFFKSKTLLLHTLWRIIILFSIKYEEGVFFSEKNHLQKLLFDHKVCEYGICRFSVERKISSEIDKEKS